ncbi:PaaI family thioesterase [soil metagenome]
MDTASHSQINYVTHTDIDLTEATSEVVIGHIDLVPHHHQPYGIVHGGVYCTLVETLASTGAALWAMDQGMAGCVGVNNSTDFLRATRDGRIIGTATPIHRGRTQQIWQVVVARATDDKVVARGQVRLQNMTELPAATT